MIYALLFISTICMTHSLHSMEIFRKKRKQTFDNYPYEFFFTRKLCNTTPQNAISLIHHYILLLRHEYFKNNFRHIKKWNDFLIPIKYQYLLPPQQIDLLQRLFNHKPINFENEVLCSRRLSYIKYENNNEYLYILPSREDYKSFLKLPIQIRQCLALLPQSKIEIPLRDVDINQYKAIGFITESSPMSPAPIRTRCIELATIIQDGSEIIHSYEHNEHTAPQLLIIANNKFLLHDLINDRRF